MAVPPGRLAHRQNPVFPPQSEAQELLHIVTMAGGSFAPKAGKCSAGRRALRQSRSSPPSRGPEEATGRPLSV